MALYNNVSADDVKRQATAMANETERVMAKIKYYTESMAQYDAATLTALGVDAEYQAQIGSIRTELAELEAWYRLHSTFIRRFAQLVVF